MKTEMHDGPTATRLIVRVLQDLMRRESFTSYADLAEALKARCAQLHIRYDAALISAAIDRLELGGRHPLIARPAPPRRVLDDLQPAPLERDAGAVLARVYEAVRLWRERS